MYLDMLTTAPARYFHTIFLQEQIFILLSLIFSPEVKDNDIIIVSIGYLMH